MERNVIFETVVKYMRLNIKALGDKPVDGTRSMKDYGAASLDMVEIVSSVMRELKIRIPRAELMQLKNIDDLVDMFQRQSNKAAGT